MLRPFRLAPPVLAIALLVACGAEDPIEPGPDTGPMTALIDGVSFIAEFATVSRVQGGMTVTAGAPDGRTIEFHFPDLGPRNYLVGPGNPVSIELSIGGESWLAEESTGEGTITVDGFTPNLLEGSFVFTVVGGPNDTTMSATNGRFLINY